MIPPLSRVRLLLAFGTSLCLLGCGDSAQPVQPVDDHEAPPSNRIEVPELVRQNLGIEYTNVARRRVVATLRLPAQVELLPTATHHYRAPVSGRVTLKVESLQKVAAGDVLYTLDSPQWRDLQARLGQLRSDLAVTEARFAAQEPLVEACRQHSSSLREAHRIASDYVADLQRAQNDIGGQSQKIATARVDLGRLAADIAEASEKHTETQTRIRELTAQQQAQQQQFELLLASAATTIGVEPEQLRSNWRERTDIAVLARHAGVVDEITASNGLFVDAQAAVVVAVDPTAVRCRARALQSDLGELTDGLQAGIAPAVRSVKHLARGTVQLAPHGDARTRTIDVLVTPTEPAAFLRPGLAVFVEVETSVAAAEELAIPLSCVLPDGTDRVFFRRDPKDPDRVIRVVADLGASDGEWIEIKSGLMDGDQVVAAGAFELVLASSNTSAKGGHFHADGTWHADGEDHE